MTPRMWRRAHAPGQRQETHWGSVRGGVWPPGGGGRRGSGRGRERGQEAGRPAGRRLLCGLRPSGHGPRACTPGLLGAAGAQRSKRPVTWGAGQQGGSAREGAGPAGRPRALPSWDAGPVRACLLHFLGWHFFLTQSEASRSRPWPGSLSPGQSLSRSDLPAPHTSSVAVGGPGPPAAASVSSPRPGHRRLPRGVVQGPAQDRRNPHSPPEELWALDRRVASLCEPHSDSFPVPPTPEAGAACPVPRTWRQWMWTGRGEMSQPVTPAIARVTRRPGPEIAQQLGAAPRTSAAAGAGPPRGGVRGEGAGAERTKRLVPGAGV